MAKFIDYKYKAPPPEEVLREKVAAAPLDHAKALLKVYELLDAAEKHGVLDLLRGAISAEDAILGKVAAYASAPEGVNTVRNLLVLGRLIGSIDPDVFAEGVKDLTTSVVQESKRRPRGFLTITRQLRKGDAVRGLSITLAALESIGRTGRQRARRLGEEK